MSVNIEPTVTVEHSGVTRYQFPPVKGITRYGQIDPNNWKATHVTQYPFGQTHVTEVDHHLISGHNYKESEVPNTLKKMAPSKGEGSPTGETKKIT